METILIILLAVSVIANVALALRLRSEKDTREFYRDLWLRQREKLLEEVLEYLQRHWAGAAGRLAKALAPLFTQLVEQDWKDFEADVVRVALNEGVDSKELQAFMGLLRRVHDGEAIPNEVFFRAGFSAGGSITTHFEPTIYKAG